MQEIFTWANPFIESNLLPDTTHSTLEWILLYNKLVYILGVADLGYTLTAI